MGAELFHADGRTDMAEVVVTFRNFSNAPKNGCTEAASVTFVTFFKKTTSKGISCSSLPVYKKGMRRPLTPLDSLVQNVYAASVLLLEEMNTKQIV